MATILADNLDQTQIKFKGIVADAMSNLNSDMTPFITPEELSEATTYIDLFTNVDPAITYATSATPVMPLSTGAGANLATLAELNSLLTPNFQGYVTRTAIAPATQEWGHYYENEKKFLLDLTSQKIIKGGLESIGHKKNGIILNAVRATSVTRIDKSTGAVASVNLPASQTISSVPVADQDYDLISEIVEKFDQVGHTGEIYVAMTPTIQRRLLKDTRFNNNDYVSQMNYGTLSRYKLNNDARIKFIVVPSLSYSMPAAYLNEGRLMADTEMLAWVPSAIRGGNFSERMMAYDPKNALLGGRAVVDVKDYFNCVRCDDAGVVKVVLATT